MSGIIQLLPDNVANQIAAGEVIQRPASVVKELMENAIDAGAETIELSLIDAGRTLIRIQDDGLGMSEYDTRLCIERHATSKIREHDDLYSIDSFGFRGEALASIAAISQLEIQSRQEDMPTATTLKVEASKVLSQEPTMRTRGTSISVKNIFYNVPARRAFLKSDNVELKHCLSEFVKIALAHPEKKFLLKHNQRELYKLKEGNHNQRIIALLGSNHQEQLVPVAEKTSIVNIHGSIGKPQFSKKSRGDQYFFVNKRFVKSGYLHHAIMNAYQGLLQEGQFPLYVLFLEIDPSKIDVNVHPTKTEIKFLDEKSIYAILMSGIKRSLSQYSVSPALDFDQENALHAFEAAGAMRARAFAPSGSPFGSSVKVGKTLRFNTEGLRSNSTSGQDGENGGLHVVSDSIQLETTPSNDSSPVEAPEGKGDKPVFQLHHQYILAQIKSGMMLIDQEAAHKRILFEKFKDQLWTEETGSQRILFQEQLELSAMDALLLHEIMPKVKEAGFEIESDKADEFVVKGIPANMALGMTKDIIHDLIEQYKSDKDAFREQANDRIALTLAKKCSVKKGNRLSTSEMNHIINELFACSSPFVDPEGIPTIIKISLEQISSLYSKGSFA